MIAARIEEIEGDRDAIRYGRLRFSPSGRSASFRYDRLSGGVTLTRCEEAFRDARINAITQAEHAAAQALLRELLPPIEACA